MKRPATAAARCGLAVAFASATLAACAPQESAEGDLSLPVLLSNDLPFRYPPELFRSGVEGDVALHLYVDSLGLVVPDSTRVVEPSAHPAFDASAVAGAPYLEFRPAQRGQARLGYAVVLPVKFRLPQADTGRPDTARRSR